MKGEWCYFNRYLDKSTCERIVEHIVPLPREGGKIGTEGDIINTEIRRSNTCFITKEQNEFSYLFDIFWKTAIRANDDFFQFNISRLNFIQFTEYDSKIRGEYKAHKDIFWLNGDPDYHRKLSATIQLSDPSSYEGGDFQLVDNSIETIPTPDDIRNQGTILYFPSLIEHQVSPVTKGTRYSLVAWFEGKKWT